ncbi:hypothetical protein F0562_005388 [Nyssa sinensis]|uniref:Nudix hydrolase domain-containing protein n=1 Tax=Nyssa sinensis TaxID=561372 RepID=A0A5J5AKC7_9ASTE|nr:hypothetical protein F0562_005388 [Nyssa sinensis]
MGMELKNMVALVSRTGRHLQRYNKGHRQVVGCIPYRYRNDSQTSLEDEEDLEVLVISSQRKGKGMLFPKGGWESDESITDAALREAVEEAGVSGVIECALGKWNFKGQSHDASKEGYIFPLLVKEQLYFWPEKDIRQRIWMSVSEAKKVCQHWWMKEALDELVCRLRSPQRHVVKELEGCFVKYDNDTFLGVEDKTVVLKKCGPSVGYDTAATSRRDAMLAGLAGTGGPYRVGGSGDIQGVAQCVGDLSVSECQDCMSEAIERLKSDCGTANYGDMFLSKCYARYSTSGAHIYSKPPDGHDASSDHDEAEKTFAIIIGLLSGVALFIIFITFLRRVSRENGK